LISIDPGESKANMTTVDARHSSLKDKRLNILELTLALHHLLVKIIALCHPFHSCLDLNKVNSAKEMLKVQIITMDKDIAVLMDKHNSSLSKTMGNNTMEMAIIINTLTSLSSLSNSSRATNHRTTTTHKIMDSRVNRTTNLKARAKTSKTNTSPNTNLREIKDTLKDSKEVPSNNINKAISSTILITSPAINRTQMALQAATMTIPVETHKDAT
jgi:hypothetical protein